jgi:hypothetical protein
METSEDTAGPNQVVVTVAALAAGLVAQKALATGWRFVRGSDPHDDDNPLPEILLFAAISAATAAVVRTWATQRARRPRA